MEVFVLLVILILMGSTMSGGGIYDGDCDWEDPEEEYAKNFDENDEPKTEEGREFVRRLRDD